MNLTSMAKFAGSADGGSWPSAGFTKRNPSLDVAYPM